MNRTSRTLGRVGVAMVGALAFLATPAIGVVGASATPASLTPISPWDGVSGGTISALNDGTNTTIHLETLLTQATGSDTPAAAVRFSYCPTANDSTCDATNPTTIATDSTAPYAVEWTPPSSLPNSDTDVLITYEALSSSNTVLASVTNYFTLDNTKATVHLTSPSDGGQIGVWPASDTFIATGTASSSNPTVAVHAFNANDTPAVAGTVSQPTNANSHTWSAIVPAPDYTSTSPQRDVEATANGTDSDEEISANFYTQTLPSSGFTAGPATQSAALSGGTATSGNYTVTATDQNGQPIANLDVIIGSSNATDTITVTEGDTADAPSGGDCATKTCALTDANGKVKFTVTRTTAGTSTITVQSDKDGNGSYDSATDESRTVSFTAYTATPTTLTTSATPSQSAYAPSEYDASNPGDTVTVNSSGTPTGGTGTPFVAVHVVDQNGNPMVDQTLTNFNYQVDRSLSDGTTTGSIAATACNPAYAKDQVGSCTTDDFGNIYLPHSDVTNSTPSGSDTFHAWIETDGVGGESAGDTKAPNLTLNFAGAALLWSPCTTATQVGGTCDTQAPTSTTQTYGVTASVGNSPRAGDSITFSNTSGIFTTTQPSGTVFDDANDAHCTTPANGTCQISVSKPTAGTVTITATDTTTNVSSDLVIDFRGYAPAVHEGLNFDAALVRPTDSPGDSGPQSTDYGCYTDQVNVGRPGDVFIAQYQLLDDHGNPMSNVSGTVRLDHGYFTDIPASYDQTATENGNTIFGDHVPWSDVTLSGTPGAGTKIGNQSGDVAPVNNGTSQAFQTDNDGVFTIAVSIGRDSAFDQNGRVSVSPTVVVGGQTLTLRPVNDEFDYCDGLYGYSDNIGSGHTSDAHLFPGYTYSTNSSDCAFFICGGYYDASATNPLSFTEVNNQPLTGNIPTSQNRNVAAWTRDSFGNLTSGDPIELDSSGVGGFFGSPSDTQESVDGSYLGTGQQNTVEIDNESNANNPNCDGTPENPDPVNPCGVAGHQDVTGTWNDHSVVYQANGSPPPAFVPTYLDPANSCSDPSGVNCTAAIGPQSVASLDWYVQAINTADGAQYLISHTPTGRIFKVGTTVTEKVTALDQHGQPLIGLFVTFYGSGPGQQGCNVSCSSSQTDSNGQASYTYAGNAQGNTDITGVVTPNNGSNNELARMTDEVGFDAVPTIGVSPAAAYGKHQVTISGKTRGAGLRLSAAKVVLYKSVAGSPFAKAGHKTANANGGYSFTRTVDKTTKFKVVVDSLQTSPVVKAKVKHHHHHHHH